MNKDTGSIKPVNNNSEQTKEKMFQAPCYYKRRFIDAYGVQALLTIKLNGAFDLMLQDGTFIFKNRVTELSNVTDVAGEIILYFKSGERYRLDFNQQTSSKKFKRAQERYIAGSIAGAAAGLGTPAAGGTVAAPDYANQIALMTHGSIVGDMSYCVPLLEYFSQWGIRTKRWSLLEVQRNISLVLIGEAAIFIVLHVVFDIRLIYDWPMWLFVIVSLIPVLSYSFGFLYRKR